MTKEQAEILLHHSNNMQTIKQAYETIFTIGVNTFEKRIESLHNEYKGKVVYTEFDKYDKDVHELYNRLSDLDN